MTGCATQFVKHKYHNTLWEQNFHEPTFEQGDKGKTQRAASRHLLSDNLCSDKNKIRARNYSFPKPWEIEMAFLKLVKG